MSRRMSLVTSALLIAGAYLVIRKVIPDVAAPIEAKVQSLLGTIGVSGTTATIDALNTATGTAGKTLGGVSPTSPATGPGRQLDLDLMAYGYKAAGVQTWDQFVSYTNYYVADFIPEARWAVIENICSVYLANGLISEMPGPDQNAVRLIASGV